MRAEAEVVSSAPVEPAAAVVSEEDVLPDWLQEAAEQVGVSTTSPTSPQAPANDDGGGGDDGEMFLV